METVNVACAVSPQQGAFWGKLSAQLYKVIARHFMSRPRLRLEFYTVRSIFTSLLNPTPKVELEKPRKANLQPVRWWSLTSTDIFSL